MTHLTAIILTYNESDHVTACVESVHFADAILVFDSNSTDDTQYLAQQAGAMVVSHPFENYAAQRNAALSYVKDQTDWVLFVDADERVTPELANEIRVAMGQDENCAGWRIPRFNYIFGKQMKATGWYPDYQTRLLRVGAAHYDPDKIVHEVVVFDGQLGTLTNHLIHYNYENLQQFAKKQRRYSQYDAEVLYEQGERQKPWSLISMPIRHFMWRFFELQGYKDGLQGLFLSLLMARYEFRKYRVLGALWRAAAEATTR